ncbi:hypothetical protein [Candidatus Entotheonella palauensis]|uniref:Uncharacterized protein n=1 Tax=Candidatus Entotheonella gemina TaxID=1429439 RepID=W4LJI2_9BACT|nr:hypothetical protein [Candidatus Entotheonella palauensis]ETW98142.1 MAG: hypothetical protein ETSY2_43235 [Candidatus Entotheonella gemina]
MTDNMTIQNSGMEESSMIEELENQPEVDHFIERINHMSNEELLQDIMRHEKEVRGIDWQALYAEGSSGQLKARQMAADYVDQLQSQLDVQDGFITSAVASLRNATANEVEDMPMWGLAKEGAEEWRDVSGDGLERKVLHRLRTMQSIEASETAGAIANLLLNIHITGLMGRGYGEFKAARIAGQSRRVALFSSIKAVTVAATRAFVAVQVVLIIAEILLFLMAKDAVVYMILLNMTDDDLTVREIAVRNGKQIVQFGSPLAEHESNPKVLPKRDSFEDDDGTVLEETYWTGIFSARKRDLALIGTLGALRLQGNGFPNSAYVGWEIPLTLVGGGPNRCLVSAADEGNADTFAKKTQDQGVLLSRSDSPSARLTGKMHSGFGSEGYMSAIVTPI